MHVVIHRPGRDGLVSFLLCFLFLPKSKYKVFFRFFFLFIPIFRGSFTVPTSNQVQEQRRQQQQQQPPPQRNDEKTREEEASSFYRIDRPLNINIRHTSNRTTSDVSCNLPSQLSFFFPSSYRQSSCSLRTELRMMTVLEDRRVATRMRDVT